MKGNFDLEHWAALVEQHTTPLLEDGVSDAKEGYEMNDRLEQVEALKGLRGLVANLGLGTTEVVGWFGVLYQAIEQRADLLKALGMIAGAHTTDEFARRCANAAIEEATK